MATKRPKQTPATRQAAPSEYATPTAIVPAKELPIFGTTDFDRVSLVKRALEELESGVFTMASMLVDAMGRDDRVEAVVQQRLDALGGLPFSMRPAKDGDAKADEAAAQALALWESIAPGPARTELLSWALWLGVGLGQNVWEERGGDWVPVLKVWHPRYVRFDWDSRTVRVVTADTSEVVVTPGDGQWVLFTPYGLERGWMKGLVRSLAIPWLIRQFALRDWARYSEVHGQPIKKAIVPTSAKDPAKERFARDVALLASQSTVLLERQKTGQSEEAFDIQLLEAMGRSDEGFDRLIARCDTAMAVRVLGQNLTTEASSGTYALGSVHERVSLRKMCFDASSLSDCLRAQTLGPWARFNYGSAELAPWPTYDTTPPEDLGARATSYKSLGEGLAALQKAGVPVDVVAEAERFGVSLSATQALPPTQEEKPAALRAALALLERGAPTGEHRGQAYADALASTARSRATDVLSGDLDALLSLVDSAESYEGLQARLLALYRDMDPTELALLTERTLLLSQLAGMNAVRENL